MKVFQVLADEGGSGFYRIKEPSRVAKLAGVDIDYNVEIPVEAIRYPNGTYEVQELKIEADVIVFQRPLPQLHHAIALAAKRQGMALVADIDDDFHNVHKQNVAAIGINTRTNPLENKRWLLKALDLCDVITVSTPALLKYARGRTQGVVVRNRMPERVLSLPRRPLCGHIGWTGTVGTHPEDLQSARGVMDKIMSPIAIVGDTGGVSEALNIPADKVTLAFSWQKKVEIYWRALNIAMDVGLVPLETSTFNNAKSWLKGIEYVSLGKPFIASPLPEYLKLAQESQAGIIANTPKEWANAAEELLTDGEQYRTAGAEWAKENTLEKHADSWIQAWELAMKVKTNE